MDVRFFPLNGKCNIPLTTRITDCSLEGRNTFCNCKGDIEVCFCLCIPLTLILDGLLWTIQLPFVPCICFLEKCKANKIEQHNTVC